MSYVTVYRQLALRKCNDNRIYHRYSIKMFEKHKTELMDPNKSDEDDDDTSMNELKEEDPDTTPQSPTTTPQSSKSIKTTKTTSYYLDKKNIQTLFKNYKIINKKDINIKLLLTNIKTLKNTNNNSIIEKLKKLECILTSNIKDVHSLFEKELTDFLCSIGNGNNEYEKLYNENDHIKFCDGIIPEPFDENELRDVVAEIPDLSPALFNHARLQKDMVIELTFRENFVGSGNIIIKPHNFKCFLGYFTDSVLFITNITNSKNLMFEIYHNNEMLYCNELLYCSQIKVKPGDAICLENKGSETIVVLFRVQCEHESFFSQLYLDFPK